jgi:hypothetical protein
MTLDTLRLSVVEPGSVNTTILQELLATKRQLPPGPARIELQHRINEERERLAYGAIGAFAWSAPPLMRSRLRNALRLSNIFSIDQLRAWGPRELLRTPAIGARSFVILCEGLGWDLTLARRFAEADVAMPLGAAKPLPALRDEQLIAALEWRGYEVRPRAIEALPFAHGSDEMNESVLVTIEQVRATTFRLVSLATDPTRRDDGGVYSYVATAYPELCARVTRRIGMEDVVTYRLLRSLCSGDLGEIALLLSRHRTSMLDWNARPHSV